MFDCDDKSIIKTLSHRSLITHHLECQSNKVNFPLSPAFPPLRVSYPSSSPAYLLGRLSSSFLSSGLGSFSVSNIHYVLLDVWLRFSPSLLRKTSLTPSKKKESSVSSQMPPMWMGAQSPPLRYLPPPPPPLQPSLSMTDTPPLSLAHSSSSISFDQKKLHSVKSSAAFVRR